MAVVLGLRVIGFSFSHGTREGLAGHSRHQNHYDNTDHESAKDYQVVQVGRVHITAGQPGCVPAGVPEVDLDQQQPYCQVRKH